MSRVGQTANHRFMGTPQETAFSVRSYGVHMVSTIAPASSIRAAGAGDISERGEPKAVPRQPYRSPQPPSFRVEVRDFKG